MCVVCSWMWARAQWYKIRRVDAVVNTMPKWFDWNEKIMGYRHKNKIASHWLNVFRHSHFHTKLIIRFLPLITMKILLSVENDFMFYLIAICSMLILWLSISPYSYSHLGDRDREKPIWKWFNSLSDWASCQTPSNWKINVWTGQNDYYRHIFKIGVRIGT